MYIYRTTAPINHKQLCYIFGEYYVYSTRHMKEKFKKFTIYVEKNPEKKYVNEACNFMLNDLCRDHHPVIGKCVIVKKGDFGINVSMSKSDLKKLEFMDEDSEEDTNNET